MTPAPFAPPFCSGRGRTLALILLLLLPLSATGAEEKRGTTPPTAVEAITVRPGSARREIAAVGTIRANEAVTIVTEIAGRVEEIAFGEGGRVSKGALLLRLDQSIAAAERDRARASLALSEANLKRAEALLDQSAISERERDEALAQYRLDEAQLRLQEAQLDKTSIRAPFSGMIGLRRISVGSYLLPGTPITTLDDIDPVKVEFRIPESYAGQIRTGRKVTVSVDALPDRAFDGTIYAIDPQIDDKGRSLLLRARLANRGGELRPGMFAAIRLALGEERQALFIPEEGVISQGGRQIVYKVVAGKVETAIVKTGLRRRGEVEIVSGLQAGEIVITAGHLKVRPGSAVTIATPPAR